MRASALLLALAVASAPLPALAHPDIDAARAAFANAELDAALAALERAETAERLSRRELTTLYELRALIHTALQQTSEAREDLRRLSVVAPGHRLDASAPPELRAVYAEIVGSGAAAPAVEVRAELDGDSVRVRAESGDDPLGLGRRLRVAGRSAGAREFRVRDADELRVEPPLISPVAYYAQLLGPGGVVVASAGEPAAPRLFSFQLEEPEEEGDDDGLLLGLAIGAGAAAVVAATIIVIAVVASENAGRSDLTDVTLPDVTR